MSELPNFRMKRWILSAMITAIMCVADSTLGLAQRPLVIRYYDHAQVPIDILAAALTNVSETFARADIRLEWVDACADWSREHPHCGGLDDAIGAIRVVILPQPEVNPGALALAHAVFPLEISRGYVAVFYDRVKDTAETVVARGVESDPRHAQALVLGHVLVHELGHLLLGSAQHSGCGIMKRSLTIDDWRLALRGQLRFTPQQQQRMITRIHSAREMLLTTTDARGNGAEVVSRMP